MLNMTRIVPRTKAGRKQKTTENFRYIHTDDCSITKLHGTNDIVENFYVNKEIVLSDRLLNEFFKKIIELSNIAQIYRYELQHKMENLSYTKILDIDKDNYHHISEQFTSFLNEFFLIPLLTQAIRGLHYKHYLRFKISSNYLWDDHSLVATCFSLSGLKKKIEQPLNKEIKYQLIFWSIYNFLRVQEKKNKLFYTLLDITQNQYTNYVLEAFDEKEYKNCVKQDLRFIWDYVNDYLYITDNYKHWAIINTEKGSPAGLYEPHCYWYKG